MMASVTVLSALVGVALLITMVSPVVLIVFLILDWKGGKQW
ncbi:hypothetical protein [Kaarinaea lacus]